MDVWSVITQKSLAAAETDARLIARARLNPHAMKWCEDSDAESEKWNVGDEERNIVNLIASAKIQVTGPIGAANRERAEFLYPTVEVKITTRLPI